jgi:signal transduction histidine kinase
VGRALHVHALDAAVPLLVGVVVAAGVVVRGDPDLRAPALALGVAAAAALAGRRRAPLATLLVSGALVLVLFHLDDGVGAAAVLAPAVALFSVSLTRGRLEQVLAALAAVAAVVAADTLIANNQVRFATVGHIALVGVPLLAAEALRNRRAYVSLLLERLALAERTREEEAQRRVEQERLRIARDLHDAVAHTLTTINVQAGVAAHLLDREEGNPRAALETIESASKDALDELRAIVGVLRDPDADAPVAPAPNLGDLVELIERGRELGLDLSLEIGGTRPERLPEAVQVAVFRIVQESLTNARRHAAGAAVQVKLAFGPDQLRLTVENRDGATANGTGGVGVGLIGMKERAAAVGGTLAAGPFEGGFRVAAELPLRRGE